ncbi:MAG: ABC transporter substrate-binding protein [Fodinibius sp.]|nr:ABC transporter substrate-binding protein [Fodinibius sp.]
MKSFLARYKFLSLFAVIVIVAGCKQPETIVVDQAPSVAPTSDTTNVESTVNDGSFRQMVMGEYHTINTLDPLFADNASSMRAVQLVYEGLVRLDRNGSVVAGLAKRWDVSNDSLKYTFTLRSNIFYHDSDIFSTGTGRRMTSTDIKYVFERMAKNNVPPKAANLFMDIRGFDAYYQEQREVYFPGDRHLQGVSGITTPTDSTVAFELNNPDPQFMKKLATPLAVIYPREAVSSTPEDFAAVGAGPFRFSSRDADSTLIFTRFQDYYNASEVYLNRVDIVTGATESKLFREMGAGNIFMLPQLGPQLFQNIIDTSGQLNSTYRNRYNLQMTNGYTEYVLRHNPGANLSADGATYLANQARTDTPYVNRFPAGIMKWSSPADTTTQSANRPAIDNQIYSTFSRDPFIRTYLGSLSKKLQPFTSLQMVQIRPPSRNTGLLFTVSYPLIPETRWDTYNSLSRFKVPQAALLRTEITGLTFNEYPWWLDLRGVKLPAAEELN